MLRGQQTIQRLIGKNPRFSASQEFLNGILQGEGLLHGSSTSYSKSLTSRLSDPISDDHEHSVNSVQDSNCLDNDISCLSAVAKILLVPCPVCSKSIPSDAAAANAHLDLCLSGGGVKPSYGRPSTQLTLACLGKWKLSRSKRRRLIADSTTTEVQALCSNSRSFSPEEEDLIDIHQLGSNKGPPFLLLKEIVQDDATPKSLYPFDDADCNNSIVNRSKLKITLAAELTSPIKTVKCTPSKLALNAERRETSELYSSDHVSRDELRTPMLMSKTETLDTAGEASIVCKSCRFLWDVAAEEGALRPQLLSSSQPDAILGNSCYICASCSPQLNCLLDNPTQDKGGVSGLQSLVPNRKKYEVEHIPSAVARLTNNPADASRTGSYLSLTPLLPNLSASNEIVDRIGSSLGTIKNFVEMQLTTQIVGRRFHQDVACEDGCLVAVRREPANSRDPMAIQVLTASDPTVVIGHLPRALAHCLAPLLDKKCITLKGRIASTPKHKSSPLPLQLLLEPDFTSLSNAVEEKALVEALEAAQMVAAHNTFGSSRTGGRGIYVDNFAYMMRTVLERDAHLFTEEETRLLGSFDDLPFSAQLLFIRLFQRKGPWFRVAALHYEDVEDHKAAVDALVKGGFCCDGIESSGEAGQLAAQDWLHLLLVPELRDLLIAARVKTKGEAAACKREELLAAAKEAIETDVQVSCGNGTGPGKSGAAAMMRAHIVRVCFPCVQIAPSVAELMWRLERLFFLNGEQDLAVFLLTDIGARRYPSYKCFRTGPIFPSREELFAYEKTLHMASAMNEVVEKGHSAAVVRLLQLALSQLIERGPGPYKKEGPSADMAPFKARFTASWVLTAIGTLGVSFLERERRYGEAVRALKILLASGWSRGRYGYWTVRLATDLEHTGNKEESLRVAEAGVANTMVTGGDRLALQRRVVRLSKPPRRWKMPPYATELKKTFPEVRILGRPLNRLTGERSRFYGFDNEQCNVEELALQYYASVNGGEWKGLHCEGGVWHTLFGLLMWDILFAPLPDVFQNPFQTAPLDLSTDAFFPARKSRIEKRIQEIQGGSAPSLLASVWTQNEGTYCTGVNWERLSLLQLQTISACVGGPSLAAILLLLAQDYGGWGAGMPDLLLWRVEVEKVSGHGISGVEQDARGKGCSGRTDVLLEEKVGCKGYSPSCGESCGVSFSQGLEEKAKESLGETCFEGFRGTAKLVEVKGPRDHLSEQQRAWLAVLMQGGLTVEVCRVVETEKELKP